MDTPLSTLVRNSRGWLAFRSAFERRRTPIPERWEELSDTGLRAALHGSRLAGPIQRPTISLQELTSTFTAGVLQQLHRALAADLASAAGDPGSLRDAMERLAAEAHVRHLGHQKTVDSVTAVWHTLALRQPLDEDQKRAALGRVLSACVHAYYEPR